MWMMPKPVGSMSYTWAPLNHGCSCGVLHHLNIPKVVLYKPMEISPGFHEMGLLTIVGVLGGCCIKDFWDVLKTFLPVFYQLSHGSHLLFGKQFPHHSPVQSTLFLLSIWGQAVNFPNVSDLLILLMTLTARLTKAGQ